MFNWLEKEVKIAKICIQNKSCTMQLLAIPQLKPSQSLSATALPWPNPLVLLFSKTLYSMGHPFGSLDQLSWLFPQILVPTQFSLTGRAVREAETSLAPCSTALHQQNHWCVTHIMNHRISQVGRDPQGPSSPTPGFTQHHTKSRLNV